MTRTIDITITISDDTDEEVAADIFDAVVESVAEQVNDSTNTAKALLWSSGRTANRTSYWVPTMRWTSTATSCASAVPDDAA